MMLKFLPLFVLMTLALPEAHAEEKMSDRVLAPCPDKPNCVNSQTADDIAHFTQPIAMGGLALEVSHELMTQVIQEMSRTEIVISESDYLKSTFTSLIFRFVDDVELLWDKEKKLIHIRSASRTGYSDLGVNKRRVENIRKLYQQKVQQLLKSSA